MNTELDTLLQNEPDLCRQVDLINIYAANLRHSDLVKAREYNQRAEQIAWTANTNASPYYQGLADCLYWRGKFFETESEYEAGLTCFYHAFRYYSLVTEKRSKSILQYEDAPDHFLPQHTYESALHNIIGVTLVLLGHLDHALVHYRRAWQLAQHEQDRWLEVLLANNIGFLHREWNNFRQSLEYIDHGLTLIDSFPKTLATKRLRATLLDNSCWNNAHIGNHEIAIKSGSESIAIYQEIDWPQGLAEAYNCLGVAHQQAGDLEQAEAFFAQALQYSHQENLYREEISIFINQGKLSAQRKQFAQAIEYLHQALIISEQYQQIIFQMTIHEALSGIYEEQEHIELALLHYKRFHNFSQMLFTEQFDLKVRVFQVMRQLEQAQHDVQIHQLRAYALEHEIREREQLQRELERQAHTDALTGILNRRAFFEAAEALLPKDGTITEPFAILLFDIDHFKTVNDTYGHFIGDQVLCWIVQIAQLCIRSNDRLARYGGEEFAVLVANSTANRATLIAERLRTAIAQQPYQSERGPITITISIGVAEYHERYANIDALLQAADVALYQAKEQGRNRVIAMRL